MDESRRYVDSAYPALLAEVLEHVLQHAGQPDQAAYALSEQIREITGARLVVVIRHDERGERPSFTVYPERRKAIAESPEAGAFFRLAAQTGSVVLWDAQSRDPVAARLLSAWHLANCMSVPLIAGTLRVGTLIIVDFSFTGNIDSLIRTMDTMSRVLGLILRNASFYQEAELLVQARTRALEAANAALRESEWKFRAIFDQTYELIGLITPDGTLIEANRTAQELCGIKGSDVLGKPFWDTRWWTHSVELQEKLRAAVKEAAKGEFVRFESTHVAADGSLRYIDFSLKPVKDEAGNVVLLIPEGRDITERKQAENALEKAKFQAELYLDLMSHDIRNYNQIAMGFLEFAMDTMDLDEGERELLSKPVDAINSSSRLIDNVVKLQKVSGGKMLENRPVDLCDILARITASYSHIPDRQVTINYSPIAECAILANDLIYDVFSNIIGNAIKHTDPGKPLTIGIRLKHQTIEGKEYLMISVEDDGQGIPDELKGKLFSRLERGMTRASGRGLGLFLVRTLVDDFGGKVWVEDRVAGDYRKGVRFVVALPAASNVQLLH